MNDPTGDLIDELVADIVTAAQEDVALATERVTRLASYPAIQERYGGDLRAVLSWHGTSGRVMRADIHRQLRARGMTLRQIAAMSGVSEGTVRADLRPAQDYAPAEREGAQDHAPAEPGTVTKLTPVHPTLHEAARWVPVTDWDMREASARITENLRGASVGAVYPVTDAKVEAVRRLLEVMDVWRTEWAPYLGDSGLREVR